MATSCGGICRPTKQNVTCENGAVAESAVSVASPRFQGPLISQTDGKVAESCHSRRRPGSWVDGRFMYCTDDHHEQQMTGQFEPVFLTSTPSKHSGTAGSFDAWQCGQCHSFSIGDAPIPNYNSSMYLQTESCNGNDLAIS